MISFFFLSVSILFFIIFLKEFQTKEKQQKKKKKIVTNFLNHTHKRNIKRREKKNVDEKIFFAVLPLSIFMKIFDIYKRKIESQLSHILAKEFSFLFLSIILLKIEDRNFYFLLYP